ncbi:MAG TPA: MJ0042-type zinc finger domain-containing protein [Vicinamibacterales bacterium]|nr:MJ0042-type zinc finger domain-containing protein [Vicinamibacterales bacterium]
MRYPYKSDAGDTADGTRAPSQCPACRSSDVTTTSKVVTADSYWRCKRCGEVWNAARLSAASRFSASRNTWR